MGGMDSGLQPSPLRGALTTFVRLSHGFLETIDADGFPRHDVGITSVRRGNSGTD